MQRVTLGLWSGLWQSEERNRSQENQTRLKTKCIQRESESDSRVSMNELTSVVSV